ncbi:helix-turn-helix domain-containing protein [Fictibacillus sp. Mic-4]|uniref:helix-turn-helix domain-containing protein n=1 Tax=Fictibacillus TaxID=1329200 RepID=UPI00042346F8|nr:helix-turn-helix domain-containing protein [Fictibacillus gelatini]
MNVTCFLTLYVLKQFNGERSARGAFHLLKGKKNAQTLADAKLFDVSHVFGACNFITDSTFQQMIDNLSNDRSIEEISNNSYRLTACGEEKLASFLKEADYIKQLNGLKYSPMENKFWQLVMLYVQCISNMVRKENQFLPVSSDPAIFSLVKKQFPVTYNERVWTANQLLKELSELLTGVHEKSAGIFVLRLSRYKRIGLTIRQVAHFMKLEEDETLLRFKAVLHHIMFSCFEWPDRYPVLFRLLNGVALKESLTLSAKKTLEWLNRGKPLEEIMKIRNLKRSTIEDHIVEIAMHDPHFPIEEYVSVEEQKAILHVYERLKTRRLKRIKDELETISYFKIRMVIGRVGVEKDAVGEASEKPFRI